MRWIVAQLTARQHYAVPRAFHQLGHLRAFYAEAWCRWGRELVRIGPGAMRAFANRYHPDLPGNLVKSFTPSYAAFHLARGLDRSRTRSCQYQFYIDQGAWFASRVAECLARETLQPSEDHFFAFNTGALETLTMLRAQGIFTVLDQIDPGREEERLVDKEREKWPGWQSAVAPIPQDYWNRIRQEWELADLVMVNSEWSKQLLIRQGVLESKLIVVPLAYQSPIGLNRQEATSSQLTVLWLGSVNLRKGIQYLVEAAKQLPSVRFVIAGPIEIHPDQVRSAPRNMTFLGRIQRSEIGELYRKANVFVLPTISDGFAITQLEAMAHGLPVVTTPNCGRVVVDGVDGLVVPAGDSEALGAALARLAANRSELTEMSRNAFEKASRFALPDNAVQIETAVLRAKSQGNSRSIQSGGSVGSLMP